MGNIDRVNLEEQTINSSYTVTSGDTLMGIAKNELGDASRYMEIAELNNIADPNYIETGQVLKIPGDVVEEMDLDGDAVSDSESSSSDSVIDTVSDVTEDVVEDISEDADEGENVISSDDSVTNAIVSTAGGNLNVRTGQGTDTSVITTLSNGSNVEVLEPDNGSGWTKIKLSDGTIGYVSSKYLGIGDKAINNIDSNAILDDVEYDEVRTAVSEDHDVYGFNVYAGDFLYFKDGKLVKSVGTNQAGDTFTYYYTDGSLDRQFINRSSGETELTYFAVGDDVRFVETENGDGYYWDSRGEKVGYKEAGVVDMYDDGIDVNREYDKDGNLIGHVEAYYKDNKRISDKYDKYGNLIGHTESYRLRDSRIVYKYDSDGRLLGHSYIYRRNGKKIINEYDENGFLIAEDVGVKSIVPHSHIDNTEGERERRIDWLTGNKGYSIENPPSRSELESMMTTVEVPVWTGETLDTKKIIVNEKLKDSVVEIFKELSDKKYPIEFADNYGYEIEGYEYRTTGSENRLSDHSFGGAIDINAVHNPMTGPRDALTENDGSKYVVSEEVINIFAKHGFYWGGDWHEKSDPMHFSYTGY